MPELLQNMQWIELHYSKIILNDQELYNYNIR